MIVLLRGGGRVDKKRNNKINSGFLCKEVRHLPAGFGKGELSLGNGRKVKIPLGRVVRKKRNYRNCSSAREP